MMPNSTTKEDDPLAHDYIGSKRLRLNFDGSYITSLPPLPITTPAQAATPFQFKIGSNNITENPMFSAPSSAPRYSRDALEADASAAYLKIVSHEQADKQTPRIYKNHLIAYQNWWEDYQTDVMKADPQRQYIPALPITSTKVVMFLQYESRRPKKVCDHLLPHIYNRTDYIPIQRKSADERSLTGSAVGVATIKQVISALEHWRFVNQSRYKHDPEAQRTLRADPQICAFESAAAHDEPKRIQMAQALKAAGTSAGEISTLFCPLRC